MAWWLAAAAIGSAIIGNDADQKASRAQRKSLRQSEKDKLRAADSLLYASSINRTLSQIEGRQVQASQLSSFASSGVDITSGSVVSTLASTESQILRNDFLAKHKAQADADLLIAEAEQLSIQQDLIDSNSNNRQFQNIIGAGINAATQFGGKK